MIGVGAMAVGSGNPTAFTVTQIVRQDVATLLVGVLSGST